MVYLIEHKVLNFNKNVPYYKKDENTFYHNTEFKNLDSIMKYGLLCNKGKEMSRGKDGDFVWAVSTPNLKGYGGCTIAFQIPKDKEPEKYKVNDDQYTFPFDISVENILFIDVPVSPVNSARISDIPKLVEKYGGDKVIEVLSKRLINDFTKEDIRVIIKSYNKE